jgi:hypothetical protein
MHGPGHDPLRVRTDELMSLERDRFRRDEPIVGWRTWNLSDDHSAPRLLPAGSGGRDAWEPRRAAEARCEASILTRTLHPHPAPEPSCTCGIHASRSLDAFERPRPAWPPPCVVGTVSLWGTVIEHERGWRARYAYPARLGLVCSMCAWFEPGPGDPTVIHVFAGSSFALCEVHRGGIQVPDGRRTRRSDVDPAVLRARLLDAYAVDLVPVGSIRSLFRKERTPDPPAYVPTIRVVPVDPSEDR